MSIKLSLMREDNSAMDDILIKKFMKDQEQRKLEDQRKQSELSPSKGSNTPNKSNMREEFLKSYLAQNGGTRHDRNFTLSWASKQSEKRKREHFLSADSKIEKGQLPGSPKGFLPSISRDEGGSPSSKIDKRITSEPLVGFPSYKQDGKVVEALKDVALRKKKSPRGAATISLPVNHTIEFLNTSGIADSASNIRSAMNSTPLGFEENGKNDNNGNIRKELEDVYSRDFRRGQKKNHQTLSLNTSPYGKNPIKNSRLILKVPDRSNRKIAGDSVLMGRFEDPYADNIPFDKPINASIRNYKNSKLKELEVKSQILRNIKLIEDSFANDVSTVKEEKQETKLPEIKTLSPNNKNGFLKYYMPVKNRVEKIISLKYSNMTTTQEKYRSSPVLSDH